ncbi:hypothetical protein J6590_064790 [Homalodisca vitripennis]|nr:hypothetical protein J6590_064790 [Homalodisca vitripennis]
MTASRFVIAGVIGRGKTGVTTSLEHVTADMERRHDTSYAALVGLYVSQRRVNADFSHPRTLRLTADTINSTVHALHQPYLSVGSLSRLFLLPEPDIAVHHRWLADACGLRRLGPPKRDGPHAPPWLNLIGQRFKGVRHYPKVAEAQPKLRL